MTTLTFDTHEFFNELKQAGFSDLQAETITKLQKAAIASTLEQARHDFNLDEQLKRRDLKEFELKMDARFKDTELKIADTKADLIRWVVAVGVLQTALVSGLLLKLTAAL